MNSNERPVTITAKQFVDNGYAAKIKNNECIVWVYGDKDKTPVKSVYEWQGGYTAVYGVSDSHNWSRWKHVTDFTVEWLPIPPSRYADLLPQTVDTVRYGSEAFEQLAREDAEAEIKRLHKVITAAIQVGSQYLGATMPYIDNSAKAWEAGCAFNEVLTALGDVINILNDASGNLATTASEPDHR